MSSLDLESVRAQIAIEGPLTLSTALGASWKLLQLHALSLLKIFVPVLLILYIVAWGLFELAIPEPGTEAADGGSPALLVGALVNIIIGTCIQSVLIGVGAARVARGNSPIREPAGYPRRDLVAAGLVVAMVPVAVVFAGPLILVLPLLLRMLLGPPVVVHEIVFHNKVLGDAFRGARALLAGSWGRVLLWLFAVGFILNLASRVTFEAASRALADLLTASASARFLLGVVNGGLEAILLAWLTVFGLVVYLDLQNRADPGVKS